MLTFNELQWAVFLYWAVSYGGNIGGDQDYVPLMSKVEFLERLRNNPRELSIQEIRQEVILFLNKWKCMVKDDDVTGEEIKSAIIDSKEMLHDLTSTNMLELGSLPESKKNEIVSIYNRFDYVRHMGPTATSKTLHILKPDLFVMLDRFILSHYRRKNPQINGTGKGYLAFLLTMSEMATHVVADFKRLYPNDTLERFVCQKLGYTLNKSLAKFMDEYNWITITKGLVVPPRWWPDGNN